jgi:hypothetical protein
MDLAKAAIFGWCLLGIVISVVLPGLWAYVRQHFPAGLGAQPKGPTGWQSLVALISPYAALGFASALTAILVLAFAGDSLVEPKAALLAGYAWDSTLQKLK